MSDLRPLGLGWGRLPLRQGQGSEHVMLRHPLHRVLAFTRRSIHDVVNDPIVKNEVLGYYKLHKQIQRSGEITELERWWNG